MTDQLELAPLGIRNNNPGNILISTVYAWRGQCGADDAGHCKFADPMYGLRAICILMVNYGLHSGCKSVDDYIGMWSKGIKGGDANYASYVASKLGCSKYDLLDVHENALPLLKAIVWFENGQCPFDDQALRRAIQASHSR